MLSITSLEEQFIAKNFEFKWIDDIKKSPLKESQRHRLYGWIMQKWNDFLKMAKLLDDAEELESLVINQYVELKSSWFSQNTYIQYQVFILGQASHETTYKAYLISELLSFFESLISAEDLGIVNQMLTEPYKKESAKEKDQTQIQSELAFKVKSMEEQLIALYKERELLKQHLGSSDADEIISLFKKAGK